MRARGDRAQRSASEGLRVSARATRNPQEIRARARLISGEKALTRVKRVVPGRWSRWIGRRLELSADTLSRYGITHGTTGGRGIPPAVRARCS